ncbi:Gfo/Idh/MocA family oxidoreductase [Pseudovibrio sp. Tun.PSC04-5.I4]|uniref:Gfo/Idh/MocA family protein n=1 Tax=Pseudovibrio sp. Tun.PSC04-5.I4 TaxID=1798213 RepID=UPI00088E09A8|nr:Gfo/Idh/MocA family oxidoreductase [Pseudovibrio sp. Tun.PSC04-5.I4]SDR22452.1 Predicted dehydrogenase [Pseudovibrio sp. Tun.PSC04-5.I4]
MPKLNWGFLGTSFISLTMADAIQEEGSTRIHSVAGRSEVPLKVFAEKYDVEHTFDDFDELIDDEAVDIIYVALPNHVHHEYVIKAANAGKAILCEKSLSVDMERTDQALKAVAENNVFFVEGLMYLNHPFATALRDVVASGELGEIHSISAEYCASIARFVNPESKGALYNLGCYPTSLMHLLLQTAFQSSIFESYKISAMGRRGADGNICETAATLQFSNGVACQLHTAEDYGLHSAFTVLGSKASLVVNSNPWLPEAEGNTFTVTPYEQPGDTRVITADSNAFVYQIRAIRTAIDAGEKMLERPAPSMEDSRQIMKILTDWEAATIIA